ncbi:MAG: hypothetical protein KKF16_07490 [Euryarchaeota archaeon]|nr:hypothetical protein [Euryarchaeota archaeon]MBU4608528.1 hypothetical protein [Euryarchaeota archaeon]MBV1730254.1 hypothetical protein [Methanobacterium sp.]MBV1756174.1 hypothetical protein [Methanobacterium sp.]
MFFQAEVLATQEISLLDTKFKDHNWEEVQQIIKDKGKYEGEGLQKDRHNHLLTVHLHINTS